MEEQRKLRWFISTDTNPDLSVIRCVTTPSNASTYDQLKEDLAKQPLVHGKFSVLIAAEDGVWLTEGSSDHQLPPGNLTVQIVPSSSENGDATTSKQGLTALPLTHSHSCFLASLGLPKFQSQFLDLKRGGCVELPKGALFPGTALRQLYIRDCYVDMLDADAEYRRLNPGLQLTFMTGTPGVGKSCFLAVHMSQCLVQGFTVIYQAPVPNSDNKQWFKFKLGESAYMADSTAPVLEFLCDRNVYFFVDGGLPGMSSFLAQCWAYTSPASMSVRDQKFVLPRGHILRMPLFSLEELLTVRKAVTTYTDLEVTEETVQLIFKLAGGIARTALYQPAFRFLTPKGLVDFLVDKVKSLNHDQALQAMNAELSQCGYGTVCDTLVHWHVYTEDELTAEEQQIGSIAADQQPSISASAQVRPGARTRSSAPFSSAAMHASTSAAAQQQEQQQPSSAAGQQRFGSANSPAQNKHRRFRRHRPQFASNYIAALVAFHTNASVRNLCARFLLTASGDPGLSSVAGTQFERLTHAILPNVPKGVKGVQELRLKLLDSGREYILRLPESQPIVFTDLDDAAKQSRADCTHYLMPPVTNFPAIDCLFSRKLLLQIASGSNHDINLPGIKAICKEMMKDRPKFNEAHRALEDMLVSVSPAGVGSDATGKRKVSSRAGKASTKGQQHTNDKTDSTRPLLVFVTPAHKCHTWNQPQLYEPKQPRSPLVQQAVLRFPATWVCVEDPESTKRVKMI